MLLPYAVRYDPLEAGTFVFHGDFLVLQLIESLQVISDQCGNRDFEAVFYWFLIRNVPIKFFLGPNPDPSP